MLAPLYMRGVDGVKSCGARAAGESWPAGGWRSSAACRAAVALALLVSGCVKPYDPFRIPREELRRRIHTIALAPIRVDPDVGDPAPTRARVEVMASRRLTAGGFTVIPAKEMERLWREAAADVGDVFDPITGQVDKRRFDLVEEAVFRELAGRYRADAVLHLSVYGVDLFRTGAKVQFCGREDAVYWPGGLGLGIMEETTLVRAACLGVTLYDMDEHVLYTIQAGIEPFETYAHQTRAVRPTADRLQDEFRLQGAVDDAVGRLAGGPQ